MCFAVVQVMLICWAKEKLFNFNTVPAVIPHLITMFRTSVYNSFPLQSTWLRCVQGSCCKYQSICRKRERIFHELHDSYQPRKFCEDLVEFLLCIWPLVYTVRTCHVSMCRSCLEALKAFLNMDKSSMFLLLDTDGTFSPVLLQLYSNTQM